MHDDPERPHHCAYVDAPFGDRNLRLEYAEHELAEPGRRAEIRRVLEAATGG